MKMSRLSSLNNKKSGDNPTKGKSDEEGLHLSISQKMDIMSLLPERIQRTRFMNQNNLEPMPQIPYYIQPPMYAFPLWQAIHDEVLNEQDRKGYEIIPLKMPIERFMKQKKFDHEVIVGKHSITDRKYKVRYLTQIPYTVTDCAKAYIRLCEFSSGNRLTPRYNKYKDNYWRKRGIKYFSGYHKGNFAYIDMESAFWSILWPTTIDMEYDWIKQEIISDGTICYYHCDQFRMYKPVRLVLHTLFGYKNMIVWNPEKQRTVPGKPFKDALYRPYNLGYIHDVMNSIVWDVRKNFTLYQWLTDAAIVPEDQGEALVEFLREEWFINSKIKYRGEGYSNRLDSYKIGEKTTGSFNKRAVGTEHIELFEPNIEGLKELRQLAKKYELPEIRQILKKPRMPGSHTALSTAIQTEIQPKPKKPKPTKKSPNPMGRGKTTPLPEDIITFKSIEDIRNREKNDD
jgi:hypothetical protein